MLSLEARDLQGIWDDIRRVGQALDLEDEAQELVFGLQSRMRRLRATSPAKAHRVLCVEWLDPLYLAGHWVPELVAAAGGQDVGAQPGSHSARRNAYSSRPGPRVVDGAQRIRWALAGRPSPDVERWRPPGK